MDRKEIFNIGIAGMATSFTYLFGMWDAALVGLMIFMGVDWLTGIIAGIINKNINSSKGFDGLLRKFTILMIVILGVTLDRILDNGQWLFRTFVCYFYIANEGISIFENLGKCGIPYPPKILEVFEQLKEGEYIKDDKSDINSSK